MYNKFFGFKERPFMLTCNPEYLFLSKCHEEALAHLTYAVSEGEGFVELTGEVGTGKTTLCRVFLENLGDKTDAAYIFNPKLNEIQLLQAINDEFNIESNLDSIKELIDVLNNYLIKQKAKGKNVIVLIDEAQNLKKSVLEQLRLLSNLETTKEKLLQIILVGQPELAEKLDSYELRQLAQRVTLSYHLTPLNFKETRDYIRYRINTASRKPGVKFENRALKQIFKFSGGVPRLINIVCDRALLTAFGLSKTKITPGIINSSIRELKGRGESMISGWNPIFNKKIIYASVGACAALVLIIAGFYYMSRPEAKTPVAKSLFETKKQAPAPVIAKKAPKQDQSPDEHKPVPEETIESEAPIQSDIVQLLENLDTKTSRRSSLSSILGLWENKSGKTSFIDKIEDDQNFFKLGVKNSGLTIHHLESDLKTALSLNLPMILDFRLPDTNEPKYIPLIRIDKEKLVFYSDGDIFVEKTEAEAIWSGIAFIPWKDFMGIPGVIPREASKETVMTLKILLKEIGFEEIIMSPYYDDPTRNAVMEVQKQNSLTVDGSVGPLTKIVLYNMNKAFNPPKLLD